MTMRCWIRNVITPTRSRTIRNARLSVNDLEDRTVPSTFTVMNSLDGGTGSLRAAIAAANDETTNPGLDDIVFASGVNLITLSTGQLTLTSDISITSPATGVTVSGGTSRVFEVNSGVSASFGRLTIAGGNTNDTGDGGGLLNSGTATLTNCTVSGNSATNGGGISNAGTLTLTNCTIVNNAANGGTGGNGGGIDNSGTLDVVNSTISGNSANFFFNYYYPYNYGGGSGAGINNAAGGTATLKNTIVSGNNRVFNNSPSGYQVDVGGIVTGTNNLTGFSSGGLVDGVDGNLVGVNPLLGTLGNYGGSTATIPLLPGSPALNAGTSSGASATDQRGLSRVGAVDIGAFESQGFTLTPVPGSTPQSAAIGTAFAKPLAVTVSANNSVEPVDGGVVRFAIHPAANGATAIGLTTTDLIIAGGKAGDISLTPNNTNGSYQASASVLGASPTTFNLTNSGSVFASLKVNTTSGDLISGAGVLSLPLAVALASLDQSGKSSITFDANVFKTAKTITLLGKQLELSNTKQLMSITGPSKGVTIDADDLSRVFQVSAGVKASMSGLTITGGATSGDGGGVANFGTLTLTNCTVSGNAAGGGGGYFASGNGGGVFNASTATLTNCTVIGNSASGYFFGGGGGGVSTGAAFGNAGTMPTTTLTNCKIMGNSASAGGGVANYGITTLNNCTISSNSAADGVGGGVLSSVGFGSPSFATITLNNCTISGNTASAGGGVFGGGGLIFLIDQYSVTPYTFQSVTVLSNCTVSGNSATFDGGGIFTNFLSTTTATNSKITGNTAGRDGGGLSTRGLSDFYAGDLNGTATLTNCTISGNSAGRDGGGFATLSLGVTTVTNCNVSGNTAVRDGGAFSTVGQVGGYGGDQFASTTVSNSTVHTNSAGSNGGGLNNGPNGVTTLTQVNVLNNSAVARKCLRIDSPASNTRTVFHQA